MSAWVERRFGRMAAAWVRAAEEVGNGENPEMTLLGLGDRRGTFIDVGANNGLYSRPAATLFSKVRAFEPIPELFETLDGTLPPNCEVHAVALSDHEGGATFRIPVRHGFTHTELASLRTADVPRRPGGGGRSAAR